MQTPARSGSTKTYRLVAEIDTTFKQQVLDLAQRKWIPDIHHHRQTDDLGRRVEIAKQVFNSSRVKNGLVCLKPFCSDNATAGGSAVVPVVKKPKGFLQGMFGD